MRELTLDNITKAVGGQLYYADNASMTMEASGVALDSRQIEKGFVFIATKGERVDGHSFIEQVFGKGAMAVICEDLPEKPFGPCIQVENSFDALRSLASFYRNYITAKIVGITGSVGKTSTKESLYSVLSEQYKVYKTVGNLNNTIGLPLTILCIPEDVDIAVVEMGINQFGEMSLLTSIARPDVCVITNIGECHLEKLIDRDGVLKAKTEIFEGLAEGGHVILCGDDDKLATIDIVHNGTKDIEPVFYGIDSEKASYVARDILDKGFEGSSCKIVCDGGVFDAHIALPGRHMILNALAATAVGKLFEMSDEKIARGLAGLKAVGGRNNVIYMGDKTIIDDCYNANPTSTKAAIDMLAKVEGTKVAIIGDMFELGTNEARYHFDLGGYVVHSMIDKIICIGELSKNTYEGAMKAKAASAYYFETVDKALSELDGILASGDTILVKASNGMKFSRIVDFLKNEE